MFMPRSGLRNSGSRKSGETAPGAYSLASSGWPEKTAAAFRGDYCSVGDMARRDGDGYYFLVDRKSNMIISGGENVYPSEIERAIY